MNTENILNDLEILLNAGQKDDAMTILKEFQRKTLLDYSKWFEENPFNITYHPYYIDEFLKNY